MNIEKEIRTNEKRKFWLGIASITIMAVTLASVAISFAMKAPFK
ncbi:hypothetical protein [Polluticoccus soli]|nr:hypothetical protein [Flavipsychrobacter sp. JY13-12]